MMTVLTADIEVIVSCDDHVGCGALLWLGGMNGVTELLTLGGREGSGQHIQVSRNVIDTDAQIFDDLQLVVGIPEVACRRGSGHGRTSRRCSAGQRSILLTADCSDWNTLVGLVLLLRWFIRTVLASLYSSLSALLSNISHARWCSG